ncbi:MAG TPA: AAA family ATPase [Kiloniellaceae bacterium]|nr:AAA family ATPase [Kiloniellaceae bacterium]
MTDAVERPFRLALFGGFTLKDPEGRLITLGLRKAEGLLAYVAAAPDQVASRETLASLLWGDFSQTKARQNLRQTLLDLSRAFAPYDPTPLRLDNQVIALEPGWFSVDIQEFTALVRSNTMASLQQAIALQRGDFLAGVTVRASDFQSWAGDLREEYHDLGLQAITALLALQEGEDQIEPAIATAKRGLQLDPLREDFHRHLIRLYSKNGMRSAAVSQFRACVRLLMEELDTEPDQETLDLYRDLVGESERDKLLGEGQAQSHAMLQSEVRRSLQKPGQQPPGAAPWTEELPAHRRGTDVTWSSPSGVLVGRQKEIEHLSRVLLDMGPAAHRAILVEGEAGIGKSHLVRSFLEGLEGAQVVLLQGAAGEDAPYALWYRLTAALRARELNAETAHMDLVEAIDSFDAALAGGNPADILARLEALLSAADEQGGSFIVFEDLHQADGPSLELLGSLLRRLPALRTAFLLTLRRDADAPTPALARFLAALEGSALAERLVLAPLSPRHIQELTRSLAAGLPNKRLSEARKDWVWAVSEGNPQVAIECLLELAQMESSETPDAQQLPAPLQARLDARMAVLDANAKQLLLAAALVGQKAAVSLLAAACDMSDAALADALDDLQAAQLVTIADDSVAFPWNRLRYAVANQVTERRRKLLHLALRDALLRLSAGRRLSVAEALAGHSWQAAEPLAALRFESLAAQRRLRQGKFEEAFRHYETVRAKAEALAEDRAMAREPSDLAACLAAIRLGMAEAADYLGDTAAALAALQGIEALAIGGLQADDPAARASILRARLAAREGDPAGAQGLAAKGIGLAVDRLQAGAWYLPDALLDRLWLLSGRGDALRLWITRRRQETAELDLQVDAVQLAVVESILAGLEDDRTGAAAAAAQALAVSEALGAPRLQALALQAEGIAAIWAGDGKTAAAQLKAGLAAAETAGDLFRGYLLRGFLGMAQALSGERAAAAETLAAALAAAEPLGTQLALPSFLAWRAAILASGGAAAEAGPLFGAAARLSGRIDSAWGRSCLAAAIAPDGAVAFVPGAPDLGCWSSGWPAIRAA